MNTTRKVLLCLASLILSACASTNAPKQRAPFAVLTPTVAKDAYHAPKVLADGDRGAMVGIAAGGLVGVMVGGLIDKSVEAAAQREFNRSNEGRLSDVDPGIAGKLVAEAEALIKRCVADLGRSADDNPDALVLRPKIKSFGLFVANETGDDGPVMGGSVAIEITIRRKTGDPLKVGPLYGYSRNVYPIRAYETSSELVQQVLSEAIADVRPLLLRDLRDK